MMRKLHTERLMRKLHTERMQGKFAVLPFHMCSCWYSMLSPSLHTHGRSAAPRTAIHRHYTAELRSAHAVAWVVSGALLQADWGGSLGQQRVRSRSSAPTQGRHTERGFAALSAQRGGAERGRLQSAMNGL